MYVLRFVAARVCKRWRRAANSEDFYKRVQPVGFGDKGVDEIDWFSSIEKAVQKASPGDTLMLEYGHHWVDGDLLIDKPLKFIGEEEGRVIIELSGTLTVRSASCIFHGMTIRRPKRCEKSEGILRTFGGVLRLHQCSIDDEEGAGGAAIAIADKGIGVLHKVKVRGARSFGVAALDGSDLFLSHCEVTKNEKGGVMLSSSKGLIRDCRIVHNKGTGVLCTGSEAVLLGLEYNRICQNEGKPLECEDGAKVVLSVWKNLCDEEFHKEDGTFIGLKTYSVKRSIWDRLRREGDVVVKDKKIKKNKKLLAEMGMRMKGHEETKAPAVYVPPPRPEPLLYEPTSPADSTLFLTPLPVPSSPIIENSQDIDYSSPGMPTSLLPELAQLPRSFTLSLGPPVMRKKKVAGCPPQAKPVTNTLNGGHPITADAPSSFADPYKDIALPPESTESEIPLIVRQTKSGRKSKLKYGAYVEESEESAPIRKKAKTDQDEAIPVWNRTLQKRVKGPMKKNAETYFASHPDCEVYTGQDGKTFKPAKERKAPLNSSPLVPANTNLAMAHLMKGSTGPNATEDIQGGSKPLESGMGQIPKIARARQQMKPTQPPMPFGGDMRSPSGGEIRGPMTEYPFNAPVEPPSPFWSEQLKVMRSKPENASMTNRGPRPEKPEMFNRPARLDSPPMLNKAPTHFPREEGFQVEGQRGSGFSNIAPAIPKKAPRVSRFARDETFQTEGPGGRAVSGSGPVIPNRAPRPGRSPREEPFQMEGEGGSGHTGAGPAMVNRAPHSGRFPRDEPFQTEGRGGPALSGVRSPPPGPLSSPGSAGPLSPPGHGGGIGSLSFHPIENVGKSGPHPKSGRSHPRGQTPGFSPTSKHGAPPPNQHFERPPYPQAKMNSPPPQLDAYDPYSQPRDPPPMPRDLPPMPRSPPPVPMDPFSMPRDVPPMRRDTPPMPRSPPRMPRDPSPLPRSPPRMPHDGAYDPYYPPAGRDQTGYPPTDPYHSYPQRPAPMEVEPPRPYYSPPRGNYGADQYRYAEDRYQEQRYAPEDRYALDERYPPEDRRAPVDRYPPPDDRYPDEQRRDDRYYQVSACFFSLVHFARNGC